MKWLVTPLYCKWGEGRVHVSFAQHHISSVSGRGENRRSRKCGSGKLLYTGVRI